MLTGSPSQTALYGVVIFVVGGFLALVLAFTRPRRPAPDARMERLQRTSGQVEKAAIVPLKTGFGIDVAVSYRIDGERHVATRHSLGIDRFPSEAAAQAALADYVPGATVPVYYDPLEPGFGCITRDMGAAPEGGTLGLGFAVSLVLIGAGLALKG